MKWHNKKSVKELTLGLCEAGRGDQEEKRLNHARHCWFLVSVDSGSRDAVKGDNLRLRSDVCQECCEIWRLWGRLKYLPPWPNTSCFLWQRGFLFRLESGSKKPPAEKKKKNSNPTLIMVPVFQKIFGEILEKNKIKKYVELQMRTKGKLFT